MKTFFVCVLFFAAVNGLFFSKPNSPDWDKLYVTFFKFNKLPISASDAVSAGWKLTTSCDANNFFAGNRYVLNDDPAVMLLFDSKEKIAGIQMGAPKSKAGVRKSPWVSEGDNYVITAYFVDPSTICSGARPQSEYIGDRLLIQTSPSITNTIRIPFKEEDIKGTKWVKGKCFWMMGQHYWYSISSEMKCEDFFPVFLLYNGNRLNGFGWNMIANLESSRYEHPGQSVLNRFFTPGTMPKCLITAGPLTTQHIYLDSPYNNFC